MTSQLEVELKLRLPDELAWVSLRRALGAPVVELHQVNTYFDTPEMKLREMRTLMVRVRDENGRLELTAKDRVTVDEDGTLRTRERSVPLSRIDWASVNAHRIALTDLHLPLCEALLKEVGRPLHPIGSMVNTRYVYDLGEGYLAEVDRTELPGGRLDYEVELELRRPEHTPAGALDALASASRMDLSGWAGSSTKYGRFLEAIDALGDFKDEGQP